MAKENKDKKRIPLSLPDMKSIFNISKKSMDSVDAILYNNDSSFDDENKIHLANLRNIINKISSKYNKYTGDNPLEFFNQINAGNIQKEKLENKTTLININKLVENPENNIINDIFFMEKDRTLLYDNFKQIYDFIPQIAQALETYVDNIMSPDDFTKTVFSIFYDSKQVPIGSGENSPEGNVIISNIRNLIERYNVEELIHPIIRDSLKLGDQFVAILKLEKEFNKMVTEEFPMRNNVLSSALINGKSLGITSEMADVLNESITVMNTDEDKDNNKQTKPITLSALEWEKEISKLVSENIEFEMDSKKLLLEATSLEREETNKNLIRLNDQISSLQTIDLPTKEFDPNGVKEKASPEINMSGSIIMNLDPSRVVKLVSNGQEFGYYYIERMNQADFGSQLSKDKNLFSFNNAEQSTEFTEQNKDYKTQLITDIFVKAIASKINRKFIENHKEFRNLIFNLVRQNYILNKKVKITYLSPDEVVHFRGKTDGDYGESLFKRILFTSKLYLAVLTSTLMQKIVRSPDKRIFYVEVGLDKDAEANIYSFIRDIKSKEIKMANFKDIDTVMNIPGTFQDMFIPTVNGEKPIEIDTLSGLDAQLDNDFLDFLLKAQISGMGCPSTFIDYTEQVEFAKTLTMQNGKFIRSTINYQKSYGEQWSKFLRILYKNEYLNSKEDELSAKETDDKNESVVLEKIIVKFQIPSSLNVTNIVEQINNAQNVIDFIVNTYISETEENTDIKKFEFKKMVTKDFVPSIDWNKYDQLLAKVEIRAKEIELEKGAKAVYDGSDGDVDSIGGSDDMSSGNESSDDEITDDEEAPGNIKF
jgi:hypothetical protein